MDKKQKKALIGPIEGREAEKEFESWFKAKVDEIKNEMLFDFFKINYCFHYKDDHCDKNKSKEYILYIEYNKPYHSAHIDVKSGAYRLFNNGDGGTEMLIDGIIHELSHIHTIPLNEAANDRFITSNEVQNLNEELTEVMANYIKGLIQWKNPKILKH